MSTQIIDKIDSMIKFLEETQEEHLKIFNELFSKSSNEESDKTITTRYIENDYAFHIKFFNEMKERYEKGELMGDKLTKAMKNIDSIKNNKKKIIEKIKEFAI